MNLPQGPFYIDDTFTFTVVTHRFDTGALTDADTVPAYRVYEDETGTAILTGNMAKLDDAGTTGFYSEQLTLSAANGFEVGKSYNIYVSAAVNSVTGATSGGFKVVAPLATVAGVSAVETDTQDIQSRLPAALVSGRIDASVGAMAANVMTAAAAAADLTTELQSGLATAAALDTVDNFLDTEVAAILAAVDTEVAAIKAKTDSLTFTVAGQVDANIQSVNDVTVTGDGQPGTEWGP